MIVTPIPAFNDNYIWLLTTQHSNACVVMDPGDASPVINMLERQGLQLTAILLTHHHNDHVGGVKALLECYSAEVYGPKNVCKELTVTVQEGSEVELSDLGVNLKVIDIPGHTLDHIAYLGGGCLFPGDTLFSAGCGRVFEGTYEQMYQSLKKLAKLPKDTLVYAVHEYTLANIEFALHVEPDNEKLLERKQNVTRLREDNNPSLPSALGAELAFNPFLRCDQSQVVRSAERHVGHNLASDVDVFAALRRWKDSF